MKHARLSMNAPCFLRVATEPRVRTIT